MSAQPVEPASEQPYDPGRDPEAIFAGLPLRFREEFRADYEAALDAARDFTQFKRIREVLQLWRLRSVAYARPGYEEAIQAAREGRDEEFFGVEHVPGWEERFPPQG